MELKIVNQQIQYKRIGLIDPSRNHFLHIGLEVDRFLFAFPKPASRLKKDLLDEIGKWCAFVSREKDIVDASLFHAIIVAPGLGKYAKEHKDSLHIPRFDITLLIEARSREAIDTLLRDSRTVELFETMKQNSRWFFQVRASNVRRINQVDHSRKGVFLFNYFFAADVERNLKVWEYSAGWFHVETGLDNSTVLLPDIDTPSPYSIINHCRWDKLTDVLPSLLFKRSFKSYVLDNFYANEVAAIPILYEIT